MYFQFLINNADISSDRLRSIRPTGVAEVALRAAHGAAMRREYADLPLSRRRGGEYLRLRLQRREDLEALVRTGIDDTDREKALDLICAICEEPYWAESIPGPFDDDAHPHIDLMAAETAVLMAWTLHEGGFVPNVRARMLRELRRRIFSPLIAHDDYPCMHKGENRALSVLCGALVAALIAEKDFTRLQALLRRIVPAADGVIAAPDRQPLKDAIADWAYAAAAWRAARVVAGAQSITRQLPLPVWLDTILFSHLGDGIFADRHGAGLAYGMNGADIYFLGNCARDVDAEALGACIWQKTPAQLSSLTARLMSDHAMDMTANTEGAPRFRHAALKDMSIMSARGGGTAALIHNGGNSNAGGMYMYMDDIPVILTCGADAVTIGGLPLTDAPGTGDGEFDDDRADMSVDITPALPKASGARFMQRTLMLDRESGMVRMIDMVECDRPCELTYTLTSVKPPERTDGALHIGPAIMRMEGSADPIISRDDGGEMFPGGLYRMRFAYTLMPGSNMINMTVNRG